jgi:adenylate cyclase
VTKKDRTQLDLGLLKTVSFWSTIGLSLLVLVIYILSRPEIGLIPTLGIFEIIEAKTLDLRFWLRGAIEPRDNIVIIAVDEKTEDALGRWQSSGRQWLAKLLDILHDVNAKVVGFDFVLAEPDEGRDLKMIEELRTYYLAQIPGEPSSGANETDALHDANETDALHDRLLTYLDAVRVKHDYDLQLAQAIQRIGNVVLGLYHFEDAASAAHLTPEKHAAYRQLIERVAYTGILGSPGTTAQPLELPHSFGVEPNLPAFSEAAKSFGHFDVHKDRDGSIRFTPLLYEYDGNYYPSFALEVARAYLNPSSAPMIHTTGKEHVIIIDTIQLGDRFIPCDEQGKLLINYYGPRGTFPYYSLSDVVSGKIPPYKFGDKLVLVGFTSKIYQDLYAIPFQKDNYPGVEINATIIANMIRGDFLTKPKWTTLIEAFIIFLLGIVLGIIRHRKSPVWGVWAALTCLLIIAGFAHTTFLVGKIWINVTFPFLFIVADYLTITSYKYFTEEKQKRGLKQAFQHYVSPTVVNQMLKAVNDVKLGGERKQLTALFADIRGFTHISEQMPPENLVAFLNDYFSEMTKIVLDYEGTVDKYIGDAIMAFYGAPVEQADHAVRACKTAVDMILHVKELQVRWEAQGLPPIAIGIGINSGDMNVGNMGSRERFEYTILGNHVNLASRLEGINKQYGTNIVISQFTRDLCKECSGDCWTVRELDTVRVKGKSEPVTIYELFGYGTLYSQKQDLAKKFSECLKVYKDRQWMQAIALFQEVLQRYPDDQPSRMYIERCTKYFYNPPPDDWDGVFEMHTK